MWVSAHLELCNILHIGLSHHLLKDMFSNGRGGGGWWAEGWAFFFFPLPPPSFPEHFCEFVGFDAQQSYSEMKVQVGMMQK